MQNSFRLLAVLAVCMMALMPAVSAEEGAASCEKTVSWGAEADYLSHYVWHGVAYNEKPVLQPSAWVSAYDFTFEAWGNYVANDSEEFQNRFSDTSLALSYSREAGKFSLEPSFEYFIYPGQEEESPATGMLSLKVSYPVGPLVLFTAHSFDVMKYNGAYFGDLGISFSRPLTPRLSMEVSAQGGTGSSLFNETYIGLPKSAFNMLEASLAVSYSPLEGLYVRPHVAFDTLTDEELRAQVNSPDVTSWGIAAGWEF